jgi:DNA-binding CsgD family transcriptional regulator
VGDRACLEAVVFRSAISAAAATSPSALTAALEDALSLLGLGYFNVFEAVSDGEGHALRHVLGRPHPQWHALYLEQRLYRTDPRVRLASNSSQPFYCSESCGPLADLSQAERGVLQAASGFGLNESYVLPHRDPDNRLFAAVLIGSGRPIDGAVRIAAYVLSSALLFSALKIEAEAIRAVAPSPAARLTQRRLECLEWARRGKSSADIGHILGLSPRTVDEHVAMACKALGVRTRVQAVSTLLALGHLPYGLPMTSR